MRGIHGTLSKLLALCAVFLCIAGIGAQADEEEPAGKLQQEAERDLRATRFAHHRLPGGQKILPHDHPAQEGNDPSPGEFFQVMQRFPDVVGMTGEEAEAVIKRERPDLIVIVMPEGSPVTMDHRLDRCRIFISRDTGLVTVVPHVG
jgi:hypothetical protein